MVLLFPAARSLNHLARFAPRMARPKIGTTTVQTRGMALGGHHGPPPEWTGIDKVVRGYFPEDYQLAIAILSAYGGIALIFKIKSALSKPAPSAVAAAPAPPAPSSSSEGMPSIESPAFEKFVESEAFYKLLENEEQLKLLVESA